MTWIFLPIWPFFFPVPAPRPRRVQLRLVWTNPKMEARR